MADDLRHRGNNLFKKLTVFISGFNSPEPGRAEQGEGVGGAVDGAQVVVEQVARGGLGHDVAVLLPGAGNLRGAERASLGDGDADEGELLADNAVGGKVGGVFGTDSHCCVGKAIMHRSAAGTTIFNAENGLKTVAKRLRHVATGTEGVAGEMIGVA